MGKFALAFVLFAVAMFALPLAIVKRIDLFVGIAIGICGAVAWLVGIGIAVGRYGPKAFWLSLTAPIGLFRPLFLARWIYGSIEGDPHWIMP